MDFTSPELSTLCYGNNTYKSSGEVLRELGIKFAEGIARASLVRKP